MLLTAEVACADPARGVRCRTERRTQCAGDSEGAGSSSMLGVGSSLCSSALGRRAGVGTLCSGAGWLVLVGVETTSTGAVGRLGLDVWCSVSVGTVGVVAVVTLCSLDGLKERAMSRRAAVAESVVWRKGWRASACSNDEDAMFLSVTPRSSMWAMRSSTALEPGILTAVGKKATLSEMRSVRVDEQ